MGEGLDLGALAPEFSLPDGDGEFHTLSEYRGQKLVILFYRTGT
ncbi:redoxin domain-containing protein [Candidatus Poribacteria bacterium]|nr:redoxin domain-containing protein [Candidatus Poribacteria bacterium]